MPRCRVMPRCRYTVASLSPRCATVSLLKPHYRYAGTTYRNVPQLSRNAAQRCTHILFTLCHDYATLQRSLVVATFSYVVQRCCHVVVRCGETPANFEHIQNKNVQFTICHVLATLFRVCSSCSHVLPSFAT